MARERSPERDEARRVWLESGGTMTARQIAEKVGAKPEQVRKWKSLDGWQAALEAQKPKKKRGGQPGNKNAAGAGAPIGNKNAETHGAYSTVRLCDLPPKQREYIEGITLDTETNMLAELQLLIAKEADLQNKITALEKGDPDALYIDRVVEMRTPKGTARLTAQHTKQARLVRVNLRRYLYAVAGFVAVAAEVRRVCGDRPVAFVGVLIRPATAKGLSTGFTMPGELAGAGAGRPGHAVGLIRHRDAASPLHQEARQAVHR